MKQNIAPSGWRNDHYNFRIGIGLGVIAVHRCAKAAQSVEKADLCVLAAAKVASTHSPQLTLLTRCFDRLVLIMALLSDLHLHA
jgi:hypothetical protein